MATRPVGKVIERIGTLEIIDTGRRCSVRNVRILAVHCDKCSAPGEFLHDGLLAAYVGVMRSVNGYHSGCDPNSAWRQDPVGTKLRHDAQRSLLDLADACPACNEYTCSGASS